MHFDDLYTFVVIKNQGYAELMKSSNIEKSLNVSDILKP